MSLLERLEQLSPRKLALLVLDLQARLEQAERSRTAPLAIVGIGCRFPGGVTTPEQFWTLVRDGRDAISEIPAARWDVDRYYDADPEAPGKMYVRRGGFLADVDRFDASFFGISPREAASLDPQHRLLLEVAWEALERAGQNPTALRGSSTGVFVGITANDYGQIIGAAGIEAADAYAVTGNALNFAAGRLSHVLGLQGPSIVVDTACSASLAAVHLACRSLRAGDCDLALAGGVNLMLQPFATVLLSKARMLSPQGTCRTFDASADGFARSEGCGLVVLKRLDAAIAAKDPIVAVIRGSAMNQDGHSSGITVPNGRAQEAVIKDALRDAVVSPHEIGYVEAHGTGTKLGDPIEVRALTAVLAAGRQAGSPLRLGSVKTNIGHAESAAGIAGLIKAVLSIEARQIPPHLHLRELNPDIALDAHTVIPTSLTPWHAERRFAGVSSFGASGTNVHIVVEQAPMVAVDAAPVERPLHVLTVSARSEAALAALAQQYASHLERNRDRFADSCFTANHGRAVQPHRLAIVCGSAEEAIDRLRATDGSTDVFSAHARSSDRLRPVFVFGSALPATADALRRLAATQPAFRDALAEIDRVMGRPVLADLTSPVAIVGAAIVLAKLWMSWGVEPAAVVGEGVGAYAAACMAGILTPEASLRLAEARATSASAYEEAVSGTTFAPPRVLFQSSLDDSGNASVFGGDYWRRHATADGRLNQSVQTLAARGERVFLEITAPAREAATSVGGDAVWLSSIANGDDMWRGLLRALAQLYVRGCSVDWAGFDRGYQRRAVLLPTYAFQRERHWIEPTASAAIEAPSKRIAPREEVLRAEPQDRARVAAERCAEAFAAVLRVASVPIDQPLSELGIDSLMAMELRNRTQRAFDVTLPVVAFLEAPTVLALAATLLERMGAPVAAAPSHVAPQVSAADAERLLGRMGEMSDSEVEALLNALSPE